MKMGIGLGISAGSVGAPGGAPAPFAFTFVNEQGSTTITASDVPELFVSIDGGAYQSLSAAGLTLTAAGNTLEVTGFANPLSARAYRFEPGDVQEPYGPSDSPFAADSTGSTIKGLWARNTNNVRPVLGGITVNYCPGLPVGPTPPGTSVTSA